MSEVERVGAALFKLMARDWIADGEARPHVVAHGPFRMAIGTPAGECPDPVEWGSLAALGFGMVVGANVVGMGSEAWAKAWDRGDAPEDVPRGALAELHDAGDATVETALMVVAADRLGHAEWLMARCQVDDHGRRSVERLEPDVGTPSGRMLDEMRRVAQLLVGAPPPLLEQDLVTMAFEVTCRASGTTGALALPIRADHGDRP